MSTGYGGDTWCWDSPQLGRKATRATQLAQACYRRLITPRGALRGPSADASRYGFDVAGFVGATGDDASVKMLPGLVAAELMKDDRVKSVDVVPTIVDDGGGKVSIRLVIDVVGHDEWGDFTLTAIARDGLLAVESLVT